MLFPLLLYKLTDMALNFHCLYVCVYVNGFVCDSFERGFSLVYITTSGFYISSSFRKQLTRKGGPLPSWEEIIGSDFSINSHYNWHIEHEMIKRTGMPTMRRNNTNKMEIGERSVRYIFTDVRVNFCWNPSRESKNSNMWMIVIVPLLSKNNIEMAYSFSP